MCKSGEVGRTDLVVIINRPSVVFKLSSGVVDVNAIASMVGDEIVDARDVVIDGGDGVVEGVSSPVLG